MFVCEQANIIIMGLITLDLFLSKNFHDLRY